MKICIYSSYEWITRVNNYGSILQYYALQQYLGSIGHDAYWLRYKHSRNKLVTWVINKLLNRKFQYSNFEQENHNIFNSFMNNYLKFSKKEYFSYSMLCKNIPDADIYITGSDQVFGGLSPERYLCFVPLKKKRIAYAASFGSYKKGFFNNIFYRIRLKNLTHLSVREFSAIEICKKYGRFDAVNVCDPSLLLSKEEYIKYLGLEEKTTKNKYLFCYFVNPLTSLDEICWTQLIDFSKQNNLNLKVVAIQGAEKTIPKEYLIYPTPIEWLSLILNAKCVITNSFHGVAYSIVLKNNFIVLPQKGKVSAQNVRYYDLLKKFYLESCIYTSGKLSDYINREIDWKEHNKQISKFIEESKKFLYNSIEA